MDTLVRMICEDKCRVLFLTGAGLSAPSGIAPYRGDPTSVWSRFLTDWGTRGRFQSNPVAWYNKFWFQTHHRHEYMIAKPNPGHIAIANITKICASKVITQNIDRLHLKTCICPERLIEIHGALGLYKCINSDSDCLYALEQSISDVELEAVPGTSLETGTLQITSAPICPSCDEPIMPQSLLFDERYESHEFYRWKEALEWMQCSDVFIFVGTSFSVGITEHALQIARKYGKVVFNFNLYQEVVPGSEGLSEVYHILGSAAETLPELYSRIYNYKKQRRIWYSNFQPLPFSRQLYSSDDILINDREIKSSTSNNNNEKRNHKKRKIEELKDKNNNNSNNNHNKILPKKKTKQNI